MPTAGDQRHRAADINACIGGSTSNGTNWTSRPGRRIEYDPNRSARIALLNYQDGEKRYILAPDQLKVGDLIISSLQADIKPGNALPLANIPLGTAIHNIELNPGRAAKWPAVPEPTPS